MKNLSEIQIYDLEEGYQLEKADHNEFSKYYATYCGLQKADNYFKKSYEMMRSSVSEDDGCFWIVKNHKKIGGVFIESNYIEGLFIIPPYNDEYEILKKLKKTLIEWSDLSKPIIASVVDSSQIDIYEKLGFKKFESGRWMIRTTEIISDNLNEKYDICLPKRENEVEMGKLLYEAFENNDGLNFNYSLEEYTSWVKDYFDDNLENDFLNRASTLVYDKETKELVGLCYISIFQEWPLISQIAVKPSYQGRGIGSDMIKKSLTNLSEKYPVVRLYVDIGNEAENVYYNLGFMKGVELSEMELKVMGNNI